MNTNFRMNAQFFSPLHNCFRALRPKSKTYLQTLLATVGCLLLLGLVCAPTFAQPIGASDQKPGSVLVFPYYNTIGTNNTRIAISNVGEAVTDQVIVHLFFLEGATCTPADNFICLTPNGGFTMDVSDIDPSNVGYIIAVAVDSTNGIPIQKNVLIGSAFVNATVNTNPYVGNYAAESFAALGGNPTTNNTALATATLNFNGTTGYDQVPSQFAVQIQSLADAPGQMIVTAGLIGDMTIDDPLRADHTAVTGAGLVGTGRVFSEQEIPYSFNRLLASGCHAFAELRDGVSPRLTKKLSLVIPKGETGLMKFSVGGAVGLILTSQNSTKYSGIRALHQTAVVSTTLTIPTFVPPTCLALMGN